MVFDADDNRVSISAYGVLSDKSLRLLDQACCAKVGDALAVALEDHYHSLPDVPGKRLERKLFWCDLALENPEVCADIENREKEAERLTLEEAEKRHREERERQEAQAREFSGTWTDEAVMQAVRALAPDVCGALLDGEFYKPVDGNEATRMALVVYMGSCASPYSYEICLGEFLRQLKGMVDGTGLYRGGCMHLSVGIKSTVTLLYCLSPEVLSAQISAASKSIRDRRERYLKIGYKPVYEGCP